MADGAVIPLLISLDGTAGPASAVLTFQPLGLVLLGGTHENLYQLYQQVHTISWPCPGWGLAQCLKDSWGLE